MSSLFEKVSRRMLCKAIPFTLNGLFPTTLEAPLLPRPPDFKKSRLQFSKSTQLYELI